MVSLNMNNREYHDDAVKFHAVKPNGKVKPSDKIEKKINVRCGNFFLETEHPSRVFSRDGGSGQATERVWAWGLNWRMEEAPGSGK